VETAHLDRLDDFLFLNVATAPCVHVFLNQSLDLLQALYENVFADQLVLVVLSKLFVHSVAQFNQIVDRLFERGQLAQVTRQSHLDLGYAPHDFGSSDQ